MSVPPMSQAGKALLTMLARPDADHSASFATLAAEDWQEIAGLAVRTRCAPLLHANLVRADEAGAPGELIRQLAILSRDQALTSLVQLQGLAQISAFLSQAGLRPIALKGVSLAFRDYPAPQLRPMRDIDLLLPAEEAVEARRLLLADPRYAPARWSGGYGLDHSHQLPEIVDIERGLVIELHHRLNARNWARDGELAAHIRGHAEQIELLGQSVAIPSPSDNLLHLVEHSTLHHAFGAGPLILSDLHYITHSHSLDWDGIEGRAKALGLERSLQLVCALAKSLGAVWVPDEMLRNVEIVPAHLAFAAQAMLDDAEIHRQHAMLRRQARRGAAGAPALRLFRPDRNELARISGRAPDSAARWLGYPHWLLEKGLRHFRAGSNSVVRSSSTVRAAMMDWLEGRDQASE